jgi:hypothetical protein
MTILISKMIMVIMPHSRLHAISQILWNLAC